MNAGTNKTRISRIAQGILDLPTLPTVVAKIVELVDNPRTNASTLAHLIARDPALTARMLKMANSAYYGFPRRIGTINLAIVILGFNTVRDLAVSASLVERVNLSYEGGDLMTDFWEHSVSTAIAARMLQRFGLAGSVGESFVAGLLHDIGRLVVARYLPDEFIKLQSRLEESREPLWALEHELLGMSHAEIGGMLCKHWNLPEALCEAIRWHHLPLERPDADPLTGIIHFAEYIAHRSSRHPHLEGRLQPIDPGVSDLLGLRRNASGAADLVWYLEKYQEELTKAESFRDLVLGADLSRMSHD